MPFPEGTKEAKDIELEQRGRPIQDYTGLKLLMKAVSFEESSRFGWLTSMEVENEDGDSFKIASWSEVVYRQAMKMRDSLPVLIEPAQHGNYYTLY